jgi:hypothetical protein
MANTASFKAIEAAKDAINARYHDLMAATKTTAQAQAVDAAYYAIELAYLKALETGLTKNNAAVTKAREALAATTKELKAAVIKAQSIAKALGMLSRIVEGAKTILALAA